MVKKNLYLTGNRISRNEMQCAEDNNNYMCHIYVKVVSDFNFN